MKKIPHYKNCGEDGHYAIRCCSYGKTTLKPIKKTPIKKTVKPKKLRLSKLKKDLDKLVKDYIKRRDNYTDQRSGEKVEGSNCHASHIFPVGSCSLLQFEPLNMIVLSYHNHINWWHKNPLEAAEWFKAKFPERLATLEAMKLTSKKIPTYELQMMIDDYKQLLK